MNLNSIFRCLLLITLCSNHFLYALDPHKLITQYNLRVYKAKDGLPMNSVKKLFQDSKGYIWIGTQEGLARFDGVQFKLYDKAAYPGLKSNFIWDIAEDFSGNLWLATQGGGVSRFDGSTFTTYDTTHGLTHNVMNRVFVARDSSVLIGTERGLSCYKNGRWSSYVFKDGPTNVMNNIQAIYQERAGMFYFGRYNAPLTVIPEQDLTSMLNDAQNFSLAYLHAPPDKRDPLNPYNELKFCSFCPLRSGDVLAGTNDGVIYRVYHKPNLSMELFWQPEANRKRRVIGTIHEDRDGVLWFCTQGEGLVRYQQGKSTRLSVQNHFPLISDDFSTILEDREGSLWVGGDGLIQLQDAPFTSWGVPEGLAPDYGHTVCVDSTGTVCVGFKSGGIALIKGTDIEKYDSQSGLNSEEISAIIPARQHGFWIASFDKGVSWFSPRQKSKNWSLQQGLEEPFLHSLFEDSQHQLWVGTRGGISTFDGQFWHNFWLDHGVPPRATVVAMVEMGTQEIWFGTFGTGLYRLVKEKITQEGIPAELRQDGITVLYRDGKGTLWIGSDNHGLYRYREDDYNQYTARDGLFSDRIFSILEDDSLNFWFSCNRGVFKVAQKAFADFSAGRLTQIPCRVYNHLDGMREAECNGRRQPSGWKGPDGRLWFTSMAGVVSVDPNHMPVNRIPPPVYIETIHTRDSLYAAMPRALNLKASERDLTISYTALSYRIPERVRFRTKLDGYDLEWQEAETRREAVYTNLPKGKFSFRVIACNNDGIWNEIGATQQIVIPPYWYETWWAIAGYVMLSSIALMWLVRRRFRRALLETQLKLQQEHATKLEELNENKSRFLASISHEFRTPLTLIKAPLKELLDHTKPGAKHTTVRIMYHNTLRLERLVQELLDLAHLQCHSLRLELCPVDLTAFIKTIVASFESLAKQRNIKFLFKNLSQSTDAKKPIVQIDPGKIEKVLLNLVFNAFKYTPERGQINVTLENDHSANYILIKVRDTGRGIPQEILPKIFDLFFRYQHHQASFEPGAGIGLALCSELVKLHQGELTATSTVGVGSEFVIRLPVHGSGAESLDQPKPISGQPIQDIVPTIWHEPAGPNRAKNRQAAVKGAPKILLIEDNPEMRYFICRHLKKKCRVIEATDGMAGLQSATQHLPDLVITDIMMPVLDGLELIKRLKEDDLTNHIPILVITAKGSTEAKIAGLELGAVDYLIKPFDLKELLIRVRNLLDLSQRIRSHYKKMLFSAQPLKMNGSDISLNDKFIRKLSAIVRERMSDPEFGPEALARSMAVSRPHLNRKLLAIIGLRTNEFIRTMRLQRAAELLQAEAGSVSEIAYQVGFDHLSYFAHSFKKQFGDLPSQFRRNNKSH